MIELKGKYEKAKAEKDKNVTYGELLPKYETIAKQFNFRKPEEDFERKK